MNAPLPLQDLHRLDFLSHRRTRCPVCGGSFDRKTNNQRLCGRRKCRNEFRRHSEQFGGSGYPSATTVIQSRNSSIKSKPKTGQKPGRAWHFIAGPEVPGYFEAVGQNAIIQRDTTPVNIVGGYRFPNAPVIDFSPIKTGATTTATTVAALPSTTPAIFDGDLRIPDFLKRAL